MSRRCSVPTQGADEPLGLYLHLPFCRHQCAYCGCAMVASTNATRLTEYLDRLFLEIDMVAAHLPHRRTGRRDPARRRHAQHVLVSRAWQPAFAPEEALHHPAGRGDRHRGRSARSERRHHWRAARRRFHPHFLRRAGHQRGGATRDRPRAAPRQDARGDGGGARAPLRQRQPRSHLRPAQADAGELRAHPRGGAAAAPRSGGAVLVRLHPRAAQEPDPHRARRHAERRRQAGHLLRRAARLRGGRLRADRHGPLRTARR